MHRWLAQPWTCKILINRKLTHCLALDPFRRFFSSCPFLGSLLHLGMRICPGSCSVTLQWCQSEGEIKTRSSRASLLPLQPHLFQDTFSQFAEQTSLLCASQPSSEGSARGHLVCFNRTLGMSKSVNFHFLEGVFAGQPQHCQGVNNKL